MNPLQLHVQVKGHFCLFKISFKVVQVRVKIAIQARQIAQVV